jgi:choline-sulfatase
MNVRQDGLPIAAGEEDPFLADVAADPAEMVNLAFDSAHQETLATLRQSVLQLFAQSLEPAFIPAFSADEAPEFLPPRIGS